MENPIEMDDLGVPLFLETHGVVFVHDVEIVRPGFLSHHGGGSHAARSADAASRSQAVQWFLRHKFA